MVICDIPDTEDPIQQIIPCLNILNKLEKELDEEGKSKLDMISLGWIWPFSSLMLSGKINELFKTRKSNSLIIVPPSNKKVKEYLERIGFPLGGKPPLDTSFSIRHFNKDPNKVGEDLFNFVEQTFPQALRGNCINYLLSELLDNVDQHSEYTHASAMAQFFPQKNMVDIGVIDNGISIPTVFEKYKVPFKDDIEAISRAVDGLSTKKENNRGYGLNSMKKITTKGLKGTFYVVSRRGALVVNQDNSRNPYIFKDIIYKGTMVYLRFLSPQQKINIYDYTT